MVVAIEETGNMKEERVTKEERGEGKGCGFRGEGCRWWRCRKGEGVSVWKGEGGKIKNFTYFNDFSQLLHPLR